jgi:hypothetical protein
MMQVTRKEACDLLVKSMANDMPEGEEFDKIVFAVNNDTQVRDFMLGLPQYFDMQKVISFVCHMYNNTKVGDDIPFITTGALLAYEVEAKDEFYAQIGYVSVHAPNYTLGALVSRIARSGWPADGLATMRKELHKKVSEACYGEEASQPIQYSDNGDGQWKGGKNAQLVSEHDTN